VAVVDVAAAIDVVAAVVVADVAVVAAKSGSVGAFPRAADVVPGGASRRASPSRAHVCTPSGYDVAHREQDRIGAV
jgi:hypothetical protein